MKWRFSLGVLTLAGVIAGSAVFAQEYQQALPYEATAKKTTDQSGKQVDNATSKPVAAQAVQTNQMALAALAAQQKQANDSQITMLMSKVMQLNNDIRVYQQNSMQRIDNLKDSEASLEQNLQKMQHIMQLFDKQVQTIQTQQGQLLNSQAHKSVSVLAQFEQRWGNMALYVGIFLACLLLVMLLWKITPRRKPAAVKPAAPIDNDSEFDFMATSEAIPAKLDLARAYLAMDDYDSARNVVAEVANKGTGDQKQQARDLLSDIDSKQQQAK